MMKRISFLVLCIFLISSCSKKSELPILMEDNMTGTAYEDSFVVNSRAASKKVYSDMAASEDFEEADQSIETAGQINQEVIERKLIRKGNVSVQVNSLEEGAAAIEDWVKKYKGYISYSYQYSNNYQELINISHFSPPRSPTATIN